MDLEFWVEVLGLWGWGIDVLGRGLCVMGCGDAGPGFGFEQETVMRWTQLVSFMSSLMSCMMSTWCRVTRGVGMRFGCRVWGEGFGVGGVGTSFRSAARVYGYTILGFEVWGLGFRD